MYINCLWALMLFLSVLCSGCMAFGPVRKVPANLIEEDVVGTWESSTVKSIAVTDLETKIKYQDARLIVKLNPDHTYEEILVHDGQHKVFQSTLASGLSISEPPHD